MSSKSLAVCFSLSASGVSFAGSFVDHLSLDYISRQSGEITQNAFGVGDDTQTWTHVGGQDLSLLFFNDEITMVSGVTVGFHLEELGFSLGPSNRANANPPNTVGATVFGPGGEVWSVPDAGASGPLPALGYGEYNIRDIPELTLTFGNLNPGTLYSAAFWSGDANAEGAIDQLGVSCVAANGAGELEIPFDIPEGDTPGERVRFAALQISECGCTVPIPEPGSCSLALLGLTFLGFRRTR